MSIRNGIIALVGAILIILGGWYVFVNSSSLPHTLNENGDRHILVEEEFYTIQAVYPNTTRLGSRTDSSTNANRKAVDTIENFVESSIKAFRAEADRLLTEEEKGRLRESGVKYAYSLNYHPYTSGSFASFEFGIYEDLGGAHPSNSYKTFVFDLEGNEVELTDLFLSNEYLTRISEMAKTQVTTQLEARAGAEATSTILAEGIAPRAENFSNWVDHDGTLIFFIPAGQVAAHAAGPFEVRVGLDELEGIVKPRIQ